MPRITSQCKENIINNSDIEKVIRDYGYVLKKQGNNLVTCCPFHGERTPSFNINPERNTYYCYGCKRHGDAVQFVMEKEGISFPEALVLLAKRYNVELRYESSEETKEQREESKRREELRNVVNYLQQFFIQSLDKYKDAQEYAFGRWGEKFCKEYGIGYAPRKSAELFEFMRKHGIDEQDLLELGYIKENEGSRFAFLRERITFPIRDRWKRIIGFTARDIAKEPSPAKYMNSKDSIIFHKKDIVFGLSEAIKSAKLKNRFILVEGGPDVLKLHSLEIYEAVAALGTAWNKEKFDQLAKVANTICFIPDTDVVKPESNDEFPPGFKSVMEAGKLALDLGFDVYVKEIPSEDGKKQDADSYIDSMAKFRELEEEHFILWYARKLFKDKKLSPSEEKSRVKLISDLVASSDDSYYKNRAQLGLPEIFGRKKSWKDSIEEASIRRRAAAQEADSKNYTEEEKMRRMAGIIIKNGQFYSVGKKDEMDRISNFTMKPIFHIKSNDNATRIYRITNSFGDEDAIELTQEEMVSLPKFKKRIENLGRFIWLGKAEQLDQMKEYLYSITKTCEQINQMGYNQEHDFYAFGNGIFTGDRFVPVDDLGLVSIEGKNYYLPAFSDMHRNNKQFFSFELDFIHKPETSITLHDYVSKLVQVFGDNAKIGFAYLIASVFRDIVYAVKDCFPILNLFGPPNSGKTALGTALMALFHPVNEPSKLANTTIPSMNMMLSRVSNAVEILDEYKNELDLRKMEILKGVWGGKGQTKMNIEIKKIEDTALTAALILCGQEMPTKDPALFTRVVYLPFSRTEFSLDEKRNFKELKEMTHKRNSHLLIELLKLREQFKEHFNEVYGATLSEVMARLDGYTMKDRILDNWIVPLAAFRTVETLIDVPVSYKDLFDITIKRMKAQNEMVRKKSELADFWKLFSSLYMNGRIIDKAHFRIKAEKSFKPAKGKQVNFDYPRMILYINFASVEQVIASRSGLGGTASRIDMPTLQPYLEMSNHYIGRKQMRMAKLNPLGNLESVSDGTTSANLESIVYVMAFDYKMLKDEFEISLETLKEGYDIEEDQVIEDKNIQVPLQSGTLISELLDEMEKETKENDNSFASSEEELPY
ncbi:MAG: DNA primase [Muribaculaceae bacterium]|nr:DNA primase [Muribaculaceae bacterium]